MALSRGTKVEWNTPQGTTHGTIVEKKTSDFQLDGNTRRASDDEPQYVVESGKTGARAAHKASALTEKSH
ncbi:hypervirulence associated TUDOR domain-containing protein [Arthrobacter sp. TMN-50]